MSELVSSVLARQWAVSTDHIVISLQCDLEYVALFSLSQEEEHRLISNITTTTTIFTQRHMLDSFQFTRLFLRQSSSFTALSLSILTAAFQVDMA